MKAKVLVVEDDAVARDLLVEVLRSEGHDVVAAESAEAALREAGALQPHVVVTDVRLAAMDGLTLLRRLKAQNPAVQVIVVTAFGSLATAVTAIQEGAFDYVSKPFRVDEMCGTVRRAADAAVAEAATDHDAGDAEGEILGRSPQITEVFKAIARVAPLDVSVLIHGETGTGKELVARAIHQSGPRADRPFVTVNCASLPEGLLESELFGHTKGAFTGATSERKGLFEAAHGGSILLDEIGDMPLGVQAKLLRVLESGEVRPVGSTQVRHVQARVLAATHRDLELEVREERFRRDLLYRLNTVTIAVPQLRERPEDLPLLTEHFLRRHARKSGRPVRGLSPGAKAVLERYSWPGNVRELSHVLERAVALAAGNRIEEHDFPPHLLARRPVRRAPEDLLRLDDVERAHILAVLKSVDGSRVRAAEILGIDRKTLYRKLLRFGVEDGDEGA